MIDDFFLFLRIIFVGNMLSIIAEFGML